MSKNTGLVQCCTVTVNLWLTFTYSIHLPRQKMGVGNLEKKMLTHFTSISFRSIFKNICVEQGSLCHFR